MGEKVGEKCNFIFPYLSRALFVSHNAMTKYFLCAEPHVFFFLSFFWERFLDLCIVC